MNTIIMLCLLFQNMPAPADLYNQANELYKNADYEQAIELYEQAAEQVINPELFYNLGNSYFKSGRIGKAIVNYRRALFMAPRDKDIKFNLMFARSYRADKVKSSTGPIARIFSSLFHFFSLFEIQILATCLFIIASIFAALYIIYRKNYFAYSLIISAFLCMLSFINWYAWTQELNARHGVIIVPETKGLSGPGEDYKEILVIHDGTEIKIREFRGDYALIHIPGGIGGWVKKDVFEQVF
jgi:tetratricopeptide (TPR) repeat protein